MSKEQGMARGTKVTSTEGVSSTAEISTEDLTLHIDVYGKVREPQSKHYFKMEGTKVLRIDAMRERAILQEKVHRNVLSQPVKMPNVKKERNWTDFLNTVLEMIELHKLKVSFTILVAVVLSVVLVYLYGLQNEGFRLKAPSQSQWLSAMNGTSVEKISPVPAKGAEQTGRRRLFDFDDLYDHNLRLKSSNDVLSKFSATSDYHLRLDPQYVVVDEDFSSITDSVEFANRMSCYIKQVRIAEVGVGPRLNPFRRPYIALVDPSLCDSSKSSAMMEWTVEATASSESLGDGEYITNFLFNEDSYSYKAVLRNTVTSSNMVKSELSWEGYASTSMSGTAQIRGALRIDYLQLPHVDIQFIQDSYNSGTSSYDTVYMHSNYNHATKSGRSVSSDLDYYYEFGFNSNELYKKVGGTRGVGFIQDDCYSFTTASRKLIHDDYNIYSAADGSLITIQEGFVLEKSSFPRGRAYVTHVDAHPLPTESSSSWVYDNTWLNTGAKLYKVESDGNVNTDLQYDFTLVTGRLLKSTNHHMTLNDMVNRPLRTTTQFNDVLHIQWDGTKLITIATNSKRCVYVNSNNEGSEIMLNGGFFINEYTDCYCLSPPTAGNTGWDRRTSGSYDKKYNSTNQDIFMEIITEDVTGTPNEFIPTATDFPRGIPISFDGIDGLIEVDYKYSQTLVGMKSMDYRVGDVLTQNFTGARGVVSVDTPRRIHGFICNDCISVTSTVKIQGTCGSASSQWNTTTLQPGLVLSQNSSSAVGHVAEISDVNSGISLILDGNNNFDLTGDIVVSMPSSIPKGSILEQYYISGTISAPTSSTLDIHSLTVTTDAVCYADFANFTASVSGAGSASIRVFYYDGTTHAYVDNIGSNCINPSVTITADHFDCFNDLPEISVECTSRISKQSSSAIVELTSAVAFDTTGDVILTTYDYNDEFSVSTPSTVYNKISGIDTITSSTVLTYRTTDVVDPTTVTSSSELTLNCYENCPNEYIETCDGRDRSCYHDNYASHLSKEVNIIEAGKCTVSANSDLPSLTFTNITGSPQIDVKWSSVLIDKDTGMKIMSVETMVVVDPGKDCNNHDVRPSVEFVDSNNKCSTLPAAHITCEVDANDVSADFRSIHTYKYNKNNGDFVEGSTSVVMTNNANVLSGSVRFGPFYEATDQNRASLTCPYSSDEVCSYRAWGQLDTMYFYETGPDAKRVILRKGDTYVRFGSPLYLTYTHLGAESNSGKNYNGATFVLKYDGPGRLSGLPQFCFDPSTGNVTDTCVPQDSDGGTVQEDDISIPPGAILYSDGVEYVAAAATTYEVYPKDTAAGACSSISMSNLPSIPILDDLMLSMNHTYVIFPSEDTLELSFLNQGSPSVVRGQTQEELNLNSY